jgi:hypothetical protein
MIRKRKLSLHFLPKYNRSQNKPSWMEFHPIFMLEGYMDLHKQATVCSDADIIGVIDIGCYVTWVP